MATNATYSSLLLLVQTTVAALGLGPSVVIRKLPTREETIDSLPQIVICPSDHPETYERMSKDHYMFSPLVQVVVVAANNGENLTNLDTYLQWRESIAAALDALDVGLASRLEYDSPINRALVADNYDYLSLGYRTKLWV